MAAHVGGDDYRCPKCGEVKPSNDFYENHTKANLLSHRCKDCMKAKHREVRRERGLKGTVPGTWTPEAIIAAIRAWAEEHGEPPTLDEWVFDARTPGKPRVFPSGHTVRETFGTWNAAIAAAGFTPRKLGAAGHRR